MACGEFDLIARYFNRTTPIRKDVELGIGDDCALLNVTEPLQVAISTDTSVSGRHFLEDIDPSDLAHKSLVSNISDLAAMGATPAWASLALTLPAIDESWLARFSDRLFSILDYYNMQLIGGDTTCGPMSITFTVQGLIPKGRALKRSGARVGDWIYVTGTLGDSAAGLAILQHRLQIDDTQAAQWLVQRQLNPQPRVAQGEALRGIATSAIDISDGLLSDLPHILKASGCGAHVKLDEIPLSKAMLEHVEPEQALRWALSGGEDYELCFTVPENRREQLDTALGLLGIEYHCIGQIQPISEGLTLFKAGEKVTLDWKGYDHFNVES